MGVKITAPELIEKISLFVKPYCSSAISDNVSDMLSPCCTEEELGQEVEVKVTAPELGSSTTQKKLKQSIS